MRVLEAGWWLYHFSSIFFRPLSHDFLLLSSISLLRFPFPAFLTFSFFFPRHFPLLFFSSFCLTIYLPLPPSLLSHAFLSPYVPPFLTLYLPPLVFVTSPVSSSFLASEFPPSFSMPSFLILSSVLPFCTYSFPFTLSLPTCLHFSSRFFPPSLSFLFPLWFFPSFFFLNSHPACSLPLLQRFQFSFLLSICSPCLSPSLPVLSAFLMSSPADASDSNKTSLHHPPEWLSFPRVQFLCAMDSFSASLFYSYSHRFSSHIFP